MNPGSNPASLYISLPAYTTPLRTCFLLILSPSLYLKSSPPPLTKNRTALRQWVDAHARASHLPSHAVLNDAALEDIVKRDVTAVQDLAMCAVRARMRLRCGVVVLVTIESDMCSRALEAKRGLGPISERSIRV